MPIFILALVIRISSASIPYEQDLVLHMPLENRELCIFFIKMEQYMEVRAQNVTVGSDTAPNILPFRNKRTCAILKVTEAGRQHGNLAPVPGGKTFVLRGLYQNEFSEVQSKALDRTKGVECLLLSKAGWQRGSV